MLVLHSIIFSVQCQVHVAAPYLALSLGRFFLAVIPPALPANSMYRRPSTTAGFAILCHLWPLCQTMWHLANRIPVCDGM